MDFIANSARRLQWEGAGCGMMRRDGFQVALSASAANTERLPESCVSDFLIF
ncbi:hypothetical protein EIKCOROL_01096 [Eikenella corrodens ATCC 23834]|uniref:Uncharacterized protein n=1 Tax=Eikenella corrodens ATCC 23834 TaxID=546274 RepID=C0DUR0_EIKCO|nr:hypothetical protein EIKCOROL_01096 [Eikenella corrodens ATCC 23834]